MCSVGLSADVPAAGLDFSAALSASMDFYAAQRSGSLGNSAIPWRGNSGLQDLPVGGYYLGTSEPISGSAIHDLDLEVGEDTDSPCVPHAPLPDVAASLLSLARARATVDASQDVFRASAL